MLDIDCLLKNTDFVEGVRKYIKYVGNAHAEDGQDASFSAVYKRLRKEGVEIDIETAGQLYLSQLPVDKDSNFSTRKEVEEVSGREFDETSRNLLLSPTKEGEQQIGDLPPRKAIAQRIANAFHSDYVVDNSTKSVLKGIQDMYLTTMDRMTPEGQPKPSQSKLPFDQLFEQHLERMKEGHRDTETGLVHNLSDLHEGVKKELQALTDKLKAEGDSVKAAQWEKHVENFHDAVYDLALSSKEAKEGMEGALMAAGYERTNAKGEKVFDPYELAKTTNSVDQLREKVMDALQKSGKFDKVTADKIARSMQREYIDRVAKNVELADKGQNKLAASYAPSARQTPIKTDDLVNNQVKEWQNYIGYKDRDGRPLIVSRKAAGDALKHVMVEAGLSRSVGVKGEMKVDIDKVSNAITSTDDIKKMAADYFSGQKNSDGAPTYDAATVNHLSEAVTAMAEDMFAKVKEHVIGKQKAIEESWNPSPDAVKEKPSISDVITKRLKEWSQYKKITTDINAPLRFTEQEAKRITGEVVKNSDVYGKEYANGDRAINWQALADNPMTSDQVEELIRQHLTDNEGYSKLDATEAAASIKRDYYPKLQEDIKAHAQAILDAKQKAVDREAPDRKTAIHRLSELSSLGIFEKENEKLLFHVLGIDHANMEDLSSLKEIADVVTSLKNEAGEGREYLNGYAYQAADRIVSQLIERNKDSEERLLRITSAINHTFGLMNLSLIGNPYNLLENNWSGANAIWGAKSELVRQIGFKNAMKFNDRKLWWSVWKDVAMGGIEYGGAGDKWSHVGSYVDELNSLNFKKDFFKALKTSLIIPFRSLLNASDAANKAVLHQKGMLLMLHKAMTSIGWNSDQAAHHLHAALYGVSFEEAKERASKLIDEYGERLGIGSSEASKKRAVVRWANDLVKANLNLSADASLNGGDIPLKNEDIIKAAIGSGFKAAAVSLGHEPNNPQSKGMQAGKRAAIMEENELIERGKTKEAAWLRLKNNVYWNGIKRMQAGGMNWAKLRADGLGLGLISYGKSLKTELDFSDAKNLEQSMNDRLLASRNATRAFTNMTLAALTIAATAGYGALRKKEDDEDKNESALMSGVRGISNSYELNKIMTKAGPDLAFMIYLGMASKHEGGLATVYSAVDYAKNIFNADPAYTFLGHLAKAEEGIRRDKGNGKSAAIGEQEVGKIFGDFVSLPLYRPFKSAYQIIDHHITGGPITNKFSKATSTEDNQWVNFGKNASLGATGGGAFQDFVNYVLPRETVERWGMEDWLYEKPKTKRSNSRYSSRR